MARQTSGVAKEGVDPWDSEYVGGGAARYVFPAKSTTGIPVNHQICRSKAPRPITSVMSSLNTRR